MKVVNVVHMVGSRIPAREEFIGLLSNSCRVNGFDELSSRIIASLFLEPGEVSLRELAKKTGYSVSAVSTSLKFIERTGIVRRVRKPKSRQVYFYMEKSVSGIALDILKRKYEKIVLESKSALPGIIERFRREEKGADKKESLRIMENYYNQVILGEKFLKKMIDYMEGFKP